MKSKEIAKNVFYAGVNDRQKALFENLWPLPAGVSYNSYLILDEKNVLIDTVDVCYSDIFLRKIAAILDGRSLDYLIINHMEPDHSGSIRLLRQQYPDVKIVGNVKTFDMLKGYHGITEGLHEVKDNDTLDIGSRKLSFHTAPMVHWIEVMFTYDPKEKILFSADAFGTFGALNGGIIDKDINIDPYREEIIRYYANIVGKYGNAVQKAMQKIAALEITTVCSTHGPVWRQHLPEAIALYNRMSRYEGEEGVTIVYGSMYGNTEQMADAIAYSLSENGIKNIVVHNAGKSHASYILADIFKYKGLIIGSPTYCNQLYPEIESILSKIEIRDIKDRLFGYFGSFSWAGTAVKKLSAFPEQMKWKVVAPPVEQRQGLLSESLEGCLALGKAMAEALAAEK
ncbi:MAG: FprA family A-type flavoprotein [Dysgonamonadaceae bacterium]|jgi:flavorubredoxin|nr:FprA family A-type flavoprotein [Dysgonamonadaceae bacterium]